MVDINSQDVRKAMSNLDKHYLYGGTDLALKQTIAAYRLSKYLKGTFHLDVFAKQLLNYICCKTEYNTEWYTLCRPGVYDSEANYYGIQIYGHLVMFLKSQEMQKNIKYKAIHDFVLHKKMLLDRLRYIQEQYDTSCEYNILVDDFEMNYKALECVRLLNIKMQVKQGRAPAKLCYSPEYLTTLINTLLECYNREMRILPQIYNCIVGFTYPKNHYNQHNMIHLTKDEGTLYDNYIEFDLSKYDMYLSRVDILRNGRYYTGNDFEYITINNQAKYYIDKDSSHKKTVREITFPTVKASTLCIYTNPKEFDYTVNLYPIFYKTDNEYIVIKLDESWGGYHDLKRVSSYESNRCVLLVTGEDPFMIKEKIGFLAEDFSFLHIRMRSSVNTIYAQVFFATIENPSISVDKSLFFRIQPDGEIHSYYLNMSMHPQWKGIVQTLRFDPAQYHAEYIWRKDEDNVCEIECMEFLKEKPNTVEVCLATNALSEDGIT